MSTITREATRLVLTITGLPPGKAIDVQRREMVEMARLDLRSAFDVVRPEDIAALATKFRELHDLRVTETAHGYTIWRPTEFQERFEKMRMCREPGCLLDDGHSSTHVITTFPVRKGPPR